MGRRNRREDRGYEPLDLTQVLPTKPAAPQHWESSREASIRAARWHQDMDRRQRDARANQGIDWNVCLVPGCGSDLYRPFTTPLAAEERDHRVRLPLCLDHLGVAAKQGSFKRDDPLVMGAVANVIQRQQAIREANEDKAKREHLARTDGCIYYIRLNGLIKVGWSREIGQRIASYGPQVEVLAVHSGTRDDETNLHRQLRPARAIGREWYEDGPILADFIAEALKQYGPPPVFKSHMTTPKQVVGGKRHR